MDSFGVQHIFTVDVEDYFQVSGFERRISHVRWDEFPSRVVANTRRVLEVLARHDVQATFFVLGWVALRFPELVREIDAAGHEIGSHSFWHRLVYEQTPLEFRQDLIESRDAIQQATGRGVQCYRAPSFSITRRSLWALDILAAEGFKVDASIFPVRHDRYGIPDAPREPHPISTTHGTIWEFPSTVADFWGLRFPAAGGGYFRLYPYWVTATAFRSVAAQGRPCVFYIHPWELDPEQPRLRAAGWMARRRHYVNLHKTAGKLERLLGEFRFGPLDEAVRAVSAPSCQNGEIAKKKLEPGGTSW